VDPAHINDNNRVHAFAQSERRLGSQPKSREEETLPEPKILKIE